MKKLISVLIVVVFFVAACGANIEREQKKWTDNEQLKTDLSNKWPALKTVIDSNFAQAKKLMDEASALSDEGKKAEKMKAANERASALLNKLRQVRDRLDSTTKQLKKLASVKVPVTKAQKKLNIITQSTQTIAEINQMMNTSASTTEQDTINLASNAISKLITTSGNIKRFEKSLKGKSKVKKKKKKKAY